MGNVQSIADVLAGEQGIQAVSDELRSKEQNDAMWGFLRDVARQVKWRVNGIEDYITAEDWKDIITAGLQKHHRMAEGIDGGLVILGMRTSKMTKAQMSDVIELTKAFGANHNVQWTNEPPLGG